jgi:hypothetical protein
MHVAEKVKAGGARPQISENGIRAAFCSPGDHVGSQRVESRGHMGTENVHRPQVVEHCLQLLLRHLTVGL